jgi:WD40 repeat protein
LTGDPAPYVYSILPVYEAVAAISSDDSLRLFDPHTLEASPKNDFKNIHDGVTGLQKFAENGDTVVTCGRDGLVKCWDHRVGKNVLGFGGGATCLYQRLPVLHIPISDALSFI